ncbi:MAG: S-methyl-5'-thioadenosine phosphorylase [Verrucomicrobia bacterium]|jgi:5'-methylthioadenosine phosphorylase|nr:S-methyl-5'-thioadenosine phosphorylase [Verrucomicrobiota bacterium]
MKIGVIGGSGLYDLEGMEQVESVSVDTPFGEPSDPYIHGVIAGRDVYFLPRHGKGHRIMPSEINHRANIFGFKKLGVDCVLSISAVGSLREELRPRDIVLPDQYFDRTKKSLEHTFFGEGLVAHVAFGEPTCPVLRKTIMESSARVLEQQEPRLDVRVNAGGTYVNMEGPAFSTKAESNAYRQFGFDVIGMTSLPEAKLCREAELCYQAMAMVTDYDCWHESEEDVTVDLVISHLMANSALAKAILQDLIPAIAEERSCRCGSALENALLTERGAAPEATKQKLAPIVGKYLGKS